MKTINEDEFRKDLKEFGNLYNNFTICKLDKNKLSKISLLSQKIIYFYKPTLEEMKNISPNITFEISRRPLYNPYEELEALIMYFENYVNEAKDVLKILLNKRKLYNQLCYLNVEEKK